MDIEGHEMAVLPCLSESRQASSLVDTLFLEDHNNTEALLGVYERLNQSGVTVDLSWP